MAQPLPAADLDGAVAGLDLVAGVIDRGARTLAGLGGPDAAQVLAYDLAHAASTAAAARAMVDYGAHGATEALLACAFVAETVHDLITRIAGP